MQLEGEVHRKLRPVTPTDPTEQAQQHGPYAVERRTPTGWQALADDTGPVPLDLLPTPNHGEPTIGHVGRYALKHRLGEGGLGRVYAAWDPILSRNLAIKVLQLGASGVHREQLDALILAEARAVARLNHPNIITVYDAGRSERGVYIAMEQLPGVDLRQLLMEGWRPDPARAARLMRRVADAMAYAHGRGVVHCDLKPSNILLIDGRKPKVLDFGIARVANRTGDAALDGMITGSPHYLAPEQLRGVLPDARTDVHAMGAVLYELLTGRKAYSGRSIQEIADAVLAGQPVPVLALAPNVPSALCDIVAKAMATDPAERFGTAHELSHALRHWQPGPAAPDSQPEPAWSATQVLHEPRRSRAAPWHVALPWLAASALFALAALVMWLRIR